MIAQHPLPSSFHRALSLKEDHSCCEGEQYIVAEREMSALIRAVRILFGDAEADRVARDWIEFAEDWNLPLVDGYPEWRRVTAAAIEQLADRRGPREELQHERRIVGRIR